MEELRKPIRLIKEEPKAIRGLTVGYRIEATKYHKTIKPGTRGGYAVSEYNVDETSWIFDESVVSSKGVRLINNTIIQDETVITEGRSFMDSVLVISNSNLTNSYVDSNNKERITDINHIKDTRITKERIYLYGRCSLVNCVVERDFTPVDDANMVELYDSHLVDSVIISPDYQVELRDCLADRLRVVGGSINITTKGIGCITNLRSVSVIGKKSFILGHELKDISLLKNVEVKNGCKIEVNQGSIHIEDKLFEGDKESIEHEYEESGNLIILG